jgi:hypothetical protein
MSSRCKYAWAAATVALTVGVIVLATFSTDVAALALVLVAAPAQTLFAIIYGLWSPWWRSLIGRALFTKAIALALLIDISLLYQWLGDDYYLRDAVRICVFLLIAVGSWMQLVALLKEKYQGRLERDDRFSRPEQARETR